MRVVSDLISLAHQFVQVRHMPIEKQAELKPSRPFDRALHHKNVGRVVCRPDAQPEVSTDFNGHTTDDMAAILMHIDDAALADEFSAPIKNTPDQREARLTTSKVTSSHVPSIKKVPLKVYVPKLHAAFLIQGDCSPSFGACASNGHC